MEKIPFLFNGVVFRTVLVSIFLLVAYLTDPNRVFAQQPEPVVAIHVSELTQTLEVTPATSPTPTGAETSGFEWWYTSWPYFVAYESLKEALRSDGTPFVVISDSDIAAGKLRNPDGSPRYPILISLAAEAIADNEVSPLRDYVSAGGFLFAGSSAFTRNPDGTTRGDFALAAEMGVHMASSSLFNWYTNAHFTRNGSHRITGHIPSGTLTWNGPLNSDQISWGVSPAHDLHGPHYAWEVVTSDATTIANGDSGPLLTVKKYGKGEFIYHGVLQPLIGHGGYDPGMYAYLIFRRAIEWAFESSGVPIVKVSPWPYQYDAAFINRHDLENNQTSIRGIESSAKFEKSLGVKGDYYFSTGALRADMGGNPAVIASLKSAVSNYGATIGSHNGGLKNPADPSLAQMDYNYWHWGPDEALDTTPPGYASGKAYASASILASFNDIKGWLSGLDNGRAGCGALGNCPRTWVSPYFNSLREDSLDILDQLGSVIMGEQKISPFPHRTMSYKTRGKYYSPISIPVSDWYDGTTPVQAINDPFGEYNHSLASITAAVDFYYDLGFLINIYNHLPTNDGSVGEKYVTHSVTKPRLWSTNSVGINDWWRLRSNVAVTPAFTATGNSYVLTASVAGATDPATAIEIVLPATYTGSANVFLNGTLASAANYRTTTSGVKVKVGSSVSNVRVQNAPNSAPQAANDSYSTNRNTALNKAAPGVLSNDTDTEGASLTAQKVSGPSHGKLTLNSNGSFVYTPTSGYTGSDSFTYRASDGALTSSTATVSITVIAVNQAPVATNDSYSTNQNTALNKAAPGVLSNDTDPEGTALTATLVSGPSHGTLTLNSNGSFVYTPTSSYSGSDSFTYRASDGALTSNIATVNITVSPNVNVLFADDFTRSPGVPDPLLPWVRAVGTWTVTNGVMQGSGAPLNYSYAYAYTSPPWTDYVVEGAVQFPVGAFGGGIGGRVDPATGAHYGAWVYPDGSPGGSSLLKLVKFHDWTTWSGTPMQQVSLPGVGTEWHALKMVFNGSRIQVYYDGTLMIDVTDNNFDSRAPYSSGGISGDMWTFTGEYVMGLDNVVVKTLP